MNQDELWLAKWQEAIDFLETNHRKPSKCIPEERNLRSWWKHRITWRLLFSEIGGSTFLKTVGSHFSEICHPGNRITATGPLVQFIEQAHRLLGSVEWHFASSMRTKRRYRAGVSAPQPRGMPLVLLDELHERWRRGHSMRLLRHYPEDVLCTPVGIVYVSMWRRVRMCIRKVSTYWGGYLEFVKLQWSHFGSVF